MTQDDTTNPGRALLIIITGGVVLTVLVGLSLSWLDSAQRRSLLAPRGLPVVDVESTIIASDYSIVQFPPVNTKPVSQLVVVASATPTPYAVTEVSVTTVFVTTEFASCSATPEEWQPYEVKPGDSLTGLAARTGLDANRIIEANCLQAAQVISGQLLYLPQEVASAELAVDPQADSGDACGVPEGWVQYRVQPSDTMLALSWQRNSTVFLIMKANCMQDSRLASGRLLFLPPLPPPTQAAPKSSAPQPPKPVPESPTPTRMISRPWTPTLTATAFAPPPSATPTNTPVPSYPSPTWTPSATVPIQTATLVPSLEPAATNTSVPSPTSTFTATPAPSLTSTPTQTMTPSPTVTATPSPTPSATSSATPSSTPSPTSSPTLPPNPGGAIPPTPATPDPYPGFPAYPG